MRPFTASHRSSTLAIALALSALTIAGADGVHEGDIVLQITGDRISTHASDEGASQPRRLFAGVLGAFGIPGVGDEPGFDNEPGTFAPGSTITATIASALTVWDGVEFVTTAADPLEGVRLRLSYDTLSVTSATEAVIGFPLAVGASGEWHIHYIFELLPAEGDSEVPPGAYMVELTLASTQPGLAASESFWIVLNHELDDAAFDEAFEAAEALIEGACAADLDGDGAVSGSDLAIVLGAWGAAGGLGQGDLDGSGAVDGVDLAIVLGAWGACP